MILSSFVLLENNQYEQCIKYSVLIERLWSANLILDSFMIVGLMGNVFNYVFFVTCVFEFDLFLNYIFNISCLLQLQRHYYFTFNIYNHTDPYNDGTIHHRILNRN